jgi:hypothetical protein
MAVITFTYEELLEILKSNNLLPGQIAKAEVKNGCFHFTVRTENFLLPFVPASLRYQSFENNFAIFELTVVSSHFNKAIGWFSQSLQARLPEYVKLSLPNVLFDMEKLFQEKNIKGIRIKEIIHEPCQFTVIIERNESDNE